MIPLRLAKFLAKFRDDATCWSEATDEIRDMYYWISEGGARFPPVGRENCRTPAEWNQKYKAAIYEHFDKLSVAHKTEFMNLFGAWL